MLCALARTIPVLIVMALTMVGTVSAQTRPDVAIEGELRLWHAVTLTLDGPHARELDETPNPFLDYAFTVTFSHESGSPEYVVPGYFAADGNAAESSADAGNKWRAHVSPDKPGKWTWKASFRQGKHAAIDGGGEALDPFDGLSGSFVVGPTDKSGRDLRGKGRLQYVDRHHLQFAGTGEYFLKVGADAPETLFAYADFDGTVTHNPKAPLKSWEPHRQDWRTGDPSWQNGKGKGLIGAVNYLADKGMNAFSFLTYNAGGDGDNIWPFVERNDKLHYDCSKLDQWRIVLEHGTTQGMHLHFKLSESENSGARPKDDVAMDEGELGPERKLYLRELIARYGHLPALNWNLGEENTQTVQQQRDMAAFIAKTDPYHHLIVTHTGGAWKAHQRTYPQLLGEQSMLTGASLQTRDVMDTHRFVLHWIRESAKAGRPWVVANDEQDLGSTGTPPDPGFEGYEQQEGPDIHDIRKYALWGTLMAGGAGIEYYFGYVHPENDILCENWRSRDRTWDYARFAHQFFVGQGIPIQDANNDNARVGNNDDDNSRYCLTKPGEFYLVYLPSGGTCELDLSDTEGQYEVRWYNPRRGGELLQGTVQTVQGGNAVKLGSPPADLNEDWLVVVRQPQDMQLFLLIGQSNMAGRGRVEPQDQTTHSRIFMLTKENEWVLAKDPLHFDKPKIAGVGLGSEFARTIAAQDSTTTVGLIPCAHGGTSLDQWKPGGKLYNQAVSRTRHALKNGTLAGILWHQGEADSGETRVATYGDRFSAMIEQLRSDLDASETPVIMGELGRFRDRSKAFNAALPEIAAQVPNCLFVTAEDLTHKGDGTHFDARSLRTFGRRYAEAWLKWSAKHVQPD